MTADCVKGNAPADKTVGIHYVDDFDKCWEYVLPSALSRRVGFDIPNNKLNPTQYEPDCKQCTESSYTYYIPEDNSTPMCLTDCPEGALEKNCIQRVGTCPGKWSTKNNIFFFCLIRSSYNFFFLSAYAQDFFHQQSIRKFKGTVGYLCSKQTN